jgi:putative ABC transport system substrate-binding protein
VKRREFITLLGSAAAWPIAARAQQSGPMRRIGVLTYWGPKNRVALAGIAAFKKALQQSGWSEGVNTSMEMRWCENSVERARRYAAELVTHAGRYSCC